MDSYLESLRAEWRRSEPTFATTVANGFAAYHRRTRFTMVAAYGGSVVVIACLLLLVWLALAWRDMLVAVAVIAFVSALPIMGSSLAMLRRGFRVRHEESPFGLLLQMRAWSTTMYRTLSSARWCAGILLTSAASAWGLFFVRAAPLDAVVMLSVMWVATAVAAWHWQVWRGRRLADEIAWLDQTIAQFRSADGDAD